MLTARSRAFNAGDTGFHGVNHLGLLLGYGRLTARSRAFNTGDTEVHGVNHL
jgi:hypothetical protein